MPNHFTITAKGPRGFLSEVRLLSVSAMLLAYEWVLRGYRAVMVTDSAGRTHDVAAFYLRYTMARPGES